MWCIDVNYITMEMCQDKTVWTTQKSLHIRTLSNIDSVHLALWYQMHNNDHFFHSVFSY